MSLREKHRNQRKPSTKYRGTLNWRHPQFRRRLEIDASPLVAEMIFSCNQLITTVFKGNLNVEQTNGYLQLFDLHRLLTTLVQFEAKMHGILGRILIYSI